MSDFRFIAGFEDVWRAPAGRRPRTPETVLGQPDPAATRGRLSRLAARAPEVMVKVTGRTRGPGHLQAHLDYISRKGALAVEDHEGVRLSGRGDLRDLALDWSVAAAADPKRRVNSPLSLSIVLSMPAETQPTMMRDAAADFARGSFGGRFDYVMALHTHTAHPHVHLAVRALGYDGERLNPRKADLGAWRERFAQALRDRGVEAEATPRRARGVTLKAERTPVRKLRERRAAIGGAMPDVLRQAHLSAGGAAFAGDTELRSWEAAVARRQDRVRSLYRAQAALLKLSPEPMNRRLGFAVEAFLHEMPPVESQRLRLARELRLASRWARVRTDRGSSTDKERS